MARQSLPLCGDGDGSDSNFTELYFLREEDNPILKKWRTEKKTDKYTYNNIQNKMIKIMALEILRETATPDHTKTLVEDYKQKYFEAIDLVTSCIKDFIVCKIYKEVYSVELEIITNFYCDNFKHNDLDTQKKTLPIIISNCWSLETFHFMMFLSKPKSHQRDWKSWFLKLSNF